MSFATGSPKSAATTRITLVTEENPEETMKRVAREKNNFEAMVKIPVDGIALEGMLVVPAQAKGLVLFAHGSGSSRLSPRNNFVAQILQESGIATLLMDLLTKQEDVALENRFDIDLLTRRLERATEWAMAQPRCDALPIGYFGASTGAAAALSAASTLGAAIGAVVSRGGRPDLALPALPSVEAPTLLIVGSLDDLVVELNRQAYEKLKAEKHLAIVEGATHLFEEPGTLPEVARLAAHWFTRHLGGKKGR
jgi:dienelactone hydrolase